MEITEDEREAQKRALRILGEALYQERLSRGFSQEEVALRAKLSVATYSTLERGFSSSGTLANPTLETLVRVMEILPVVPSVLLALHGGQ